MIFFLGGCLLCKSTNLESPAWSSAPALQPAHQCASPTASLSSAGLTVKMVVAFEIPLDHNLEPTKSCHFYNSCVLQQMRKSSQSIPGSAGPGRDWAEMQSRHANGLSSTKSGVELSNQCLVHAASQKQSMLNLRSDFSHLYSSCGTPSATWKGNTGRIWEV